MALSEFDRGLIAAVQSGLPLVPRPYAALGAALGVSAEAVRERLAGMLASGLIRPMQFGPTMRIPDRCAIATSWRCRSRP